MSKRFWISLFLLLFLVTSRAWAVASTEGKQGLMKLGDNLPSFTAVDVVDGQTVSSEDIVGKKPALIVVLCEHCPFVKHVRGGLASLTQDYQGKDIVMIGVSSNDIAKYPTDSPEHLKNMAVSEKIMMPIIYDESQVIAKSLTAVATPDFFLFDKSGKLVYRGQMDASRPGNEVPVTGEDIRRAIDAVLAGQTPSPEGQKAAAGCSIKWKKSNEPGHL